MTPVRERWLHLSSSGRNRRANLRAEDLDLAVQKAPWTVMMKNAAAFALLFLVSACGQTRAAPSSPKEEAAPVRAAPVDRGAVLAILRAAGTVHPKDERALSFKVGGVVARIRVNAGDPVKRGQVLAELDTTEVAVAARQAKEGLRKAERDRDRALSLAEQDVAPRAMAEDAETAAEVARAGVAGAEFNLERAVLKAPDDGWVEERLAEPGRWWRPAARSCG